MFLLAFCVDGRDWGRFREVKKAVKNVDDYEESMGADWCPLLN